MGKLNIQSKLKIIRDSFLDLEVRNDLFQKKIKGFEFWDFIRHWAYLEICSKKKLFSVNWVTVSLSKSKIIWKYFKELIFVPIFLSKSIFNKLKNNQKKVDIIIFLDENKTKINSSLFNTYCHEIIIHLLPNYNLLLVDHSRFDKNILGSYPCRIINSRFFFLLSRLKCQLFKFNDKEKKIIKGLNDIMYDKFGEKVDLESTIRKYFIFQVPLFSYANRLIKKYKPKIVLFTDDGVSNYIPQAAKNNGIYSAEIQHGSVSDYELLRNYSNIDAKLLKTKPEYIFTHSEYWNMKYNVNLEKLVIGNSNLNFILGRDAKINGYNVENKQYTLLFVSTLDHRLAHLASNFSLKYDNFSVVYKLRAEEYQHWRTIYPDEIVSNKKIKFIENDDKGLYEILNEVNYVISSNSTLLFEALNEKKKCIVYKGNYWEITEDLISDNIMPIVENEEQLFDIVNNRWSFEHFNGEIYSAFSEKKLEKSINRIMNC